MSFHHTQHPTRERGSALLPLVAAMLILVLTGVVLSETFGSQRRESLMDVQATRAHWIAEAGLWHAAHEKTELTTPVPFAGGSYTVSKDDLTYTSTAEQGEATGSASRWMWLPGGPLDEAASVATVAIWDSKRFTIDLVSIWPEDVVIASFELSDDAGGAYQAHRFKLDNTDIWHEHGGVDIPTGVTTFNNGLTQNRTVPSSGSPTLLFQSHTAPASTVTYTLVLNFTYGGKSTLEFSVPW